MEVEYTDSNNSSSELKKTENTFDASDINSAIETNSSSNVITLNAQKSVKFDHVKKMEIKKKIEKIKKKEYLIDIFKIITSHTQDYSENNNGVFIFFHDLSDEIYEKVDNYVNNIYRLYKTNNNSGNIFNSEISESIGDNSEKNIDKHLTNKEKIIFRRKKYEEYLSHNQE
jgi:hypothetical protein